MSKQLVLRPEKCISCRTCELVCSFGHNGRFNPGESAITIQDTEEATTLVMCLQCEEAHCMEVCPSGAISRDANGTVCIDHEICINCKLCVDACPHGGIRVSPVDDRVFKCDLCGGAPKCAAFCPSKAIVWGDAEQGQDVSGEEVRS